ncbi:hypothetical protein QQ045_032047 [Rhodiola kirilowii]
METNSAECSCVEMPHWLPTCCLRMIPFSSLRRRLQRLVPSKEFSVNLKQCGQRVNYEKSEICFSRNTPGEVRIRVCNVFGVAQVSSHSRYLGLPLMVGQRKTEICRSIVEKIWRRVND